MKRKKSWGSSVSPYKMTDRDTFLFAIVERCFVLIMLQLFFFTLLLFGHIEIFFMHWDNMCRFFTVCRDAITDGCGGETCTNWMHKSNGIRFLRYYRRFEMNSVFWIFSSLDSSSSVSLWNSLCSHQIKIYVKVTQLLTRCTWLESKPFCIRAGGLNAFEFDISFETCKMSNQLRCDQSCHA